MTGSSLQALVAAAEIQSGTEGAPPPGNEENASTVEAVNNSAAGTTITTTTAIATATATETATTVTTDITTNPPPPPPAHDTQVQLNTDDEEQPPLTTSDIPQHQALLQQPIFANPIAVADPTTTTTTTTVPENASNVGLQSTTANPIASSDDPATVTENHPLTLDTVSQTANPIISETDDQNGATTTTTTTTANPIVPEVHVNPVVVAASAPVTAAVPIVAPGVVTANPVVPEMTTTTVSQVPVAPPQIPTPTMTANPVVAPIPTPVATAAATATTNIVHAQPTNLEFNIDVKMEEPAPALPVLNSDPNGIKVEDAAAVERAQQEAIAAAVVANNHNPPPALPQAVSTDATTMPVVSVPVPVPVPVSVPPLTTTTAVAAAAAPSSGSKPARKRGWVKKTWEERLEELKAYKAVHGDCNVPTICKANPSLGHWVHDQRKQYRLYQNNKQTSMNPLRIAQLEEVGFKWALQRHTTMRSWAERFAQLEDFKKDNGHCNVPIRYKTNPSLGQWVSTQRQEYSNYRNGKKSNMTQERITKLEAAEFCWSLRDTAKMAPRKSWDMHFAALKEFKKQHGHCDVRVRSKQNPTGSLGRWVEKQRSQYHSKNEGKDSKLTQDQIDKLDSIGFKWRIRHERNKISGCARNPALKIDNEAMMDDYTRRALDESAREMQVSTQVVAQTQVHVQQEHLGPIEQMQHVVHEPQLQEQQPIQQVVHDSQMQTQEQIHEQIQQQAHHIDGQTEQMDAQMDVQMDVQLEAAPIKVENTLDGAVQVTIEPMTIETAAAVAAVEGIPVEAQPQPGTIPVHVPVPESVPAPVSVVMPIHEGIEDTMTHSV